MKCLAQLARSGKTLIFSIHQPRSNIFQTFDLILLLTDKGQMAYFGPAKKSVDFVQVCKRWRRASVLHCFADVCGENCIRSEL